VRTITISRLKQELADGIRGRRCVEAWLGHGQPLFLVLGDHAVPDPEHAERHPYPHYEIQTHDADWWVEEGAEIRGTADDEREHAVAACKLLVGRHAVDWHLDDTTLTLKVGFEGNFTLTVQPRKGEDALGCDAWGFLNPEREYLCVITGGGLYNVHYDEPMKSELPARRLDRRHGGYP
jgi:hypothetical protein